MTTTVSYILFINALIETKSSSFQAFVFCHAFERLDETKCMHFLPIRM